MGGGGEGRSDARPSSTAPDFHSGPGVSAVTPCYRPPCAESDLEIVNAIFENGQFRPEHPLPLPEGARVRLAGVESVTCNWLWPPAVTPICSVPFPPRSVRGWVSYSGPPMAVGAGSVTRPSSRPGSSSNAVPTPSKARSRPSLPVAACSLQQRSSCLGMLRNPESCGTSSVASGEVCHRPSLPAMCSD